MKMKLTTTERMAGFKYCSSINEIQRNFYWFIGVITWPLKTWPLDWLWLIKASVTSHYFLHKLQLDSCVFFSGPVEGKWSVMPVERTLLINDVIRFLSMFMSLKYRLFFVRFYVTFKSFSSYMLLTIYVELMWKKQLLSSFLAYEIYATCEIYCQSFQSGNRYHPSCKIVERKRAQ